MAKEKSSLTAGEVCSILVAATKSKVSVLKFGDLYVRFGDREPERKALDGKNLGQTPSPAPEIAETQRTEESRAILQDEVNTRESQLTQMTIENPVAYEQMLTEGDLLTDDDDETGDSS